MNLCSISCTLPFREKVSEDFYQKASHGPIGDGHFESDKFFTELLGFEISSAISVLMNVDKISGVFVYKVVLSISN